MPSCPRCGVENADGKAACWSCFAPMAARAEQFRGAAAAATVREAAPAKPVKKVMLVVFAAAVLAAVAYFLALRPLLQLGPATVGRKYLEAVKAGDATLQAEYTTTAAMSRKLSGVVLLKELGAKGIRPTGFAADTVAERSGDARTLKATLTFPPPAAAEIADLPVAWRERLREGGSLPVALSLVREGGSWKVDKVTLSAAPGVVPPGPMPIPPAPPAPGAESRGPNSKAPGGAGGGGSED